VVKVVFSRHLYRLEAVQAAAEVYADFADIGLEVGDDEVRVTLADPDPEIGDELYDAFCNHALFESIVGHRAEAGQAEVGG